MATYECSLNFGWSEAQRISIESGRLTGVWIPYVPPRQNSCFKSQMLNISQAYFFFVSFFILPSEEESFSAKADARSCINIQVSIPSFILEYPQQWNTERVLLYHLHGKSKFLLIFQMIKLKLVVVLCFHATNMRIIWVELLN